MGRVICMDTCRRHLLNKGNDELISWKNVKLLTLVKCFQVN